VCRNVQHAGGKAIIVLAGMQPLNAVTFIGDGIFQGAKLSISLAAWLLHARSRPV
jgi:hypothetical protein